MSKSKSLIPYDQELVNKKEGCILRLFIKLFRDLPLFQIMDQIKGMLREMLRFLKKTIGKSHSKEW